MQAGDVRVRAMHGRRHRPSGARAGHVAGMDDAKAGTDDEPPCGPKVLQQSTLTQEHLSSPLAQLTYLLHHYGSWHTGSHVCEQPTLA